MSKDGHNVSGKHDARPTIAYLAPEVVFGPTPTSLWSGVEAGAREQDLNLIAFPGGNIRVRYRQREHANTIYDLVTPETFAGLVTWASALQYRGSSRSQEALSEEEVLALHARYHPLPIVTLSKAVPGYPAVLVESEQGMRDAVAHLIEVHGCHRIAFIRGPKAHPLAEARYRAYLDTLADHGIEVNADLVTPPEDFEGERGAQAVDLFLDQRNLRPKEDLEAIVAASDVFALTAMEGLQRRGVRVPEDVAVVGFNDSAEARCASPPITSVTVPFREQGRQAVRALKRVLEGKSVPDEMLIPSRLAIHQSCGCLDATVAQAGAFSPRIGEGASLEEALEARRETIVREMAQAMDISEVPTWAERVLDGFILDLGGSQPGEFLTALREVLQRATLADRASPAWQNVLSVLQRHAALGVDPQRALLLIGQARAMLGETTSRALAQLQLQAERHVQSLQMISADLIATFEVERLMDVLAEGLPTLGIPGCYLALYEDPQPYEYPQPAPEWSRLILAYNEDGRVALEPGGDRFPTRRLLPEGMLPVHRRYTMVVQALYFQDAQIGFVLFEVGPQDWSVYDALRVEVASALHGARLTEQTARRAVQLLTAAEVSRSVTSVLDLDVLLQQVVELVQQRFDLYYVGLFLVSTEADGTWAMLRAASGGAGRQMLAQGHRLKVGGESMIGQCIADHQSRIALDVGEAAVRFDNPLLPETHSEMALPLITREGAVGALSIQSSERRAFGDTDLAVFETLAGQLANAIANARAYEQVAMAYAEVEVLNERLKDENLRMGAELEVTQRLQQMLLPTEEELEQIEELDIAGFMEPADEVGGDYYDVLNHNGQIKIGIGDVTGHGLESGVVMLMLQTAVRTLMTSDEQDPARFLDILNRLLQENTRRMQVDKSMTLALLDYQLGQMRVSGQHEQVIVVRNGGQVELKDTLDLGFPLGLMSGVTELVQEMSIDLQPGDGIVLYSDGITEAENEAEEFYGLERLCQVVGVHWEGSAEAVRDSVVADVKAFIGSHKVYDDITLVVAKQR